MNTDWLDEVGQDFMDEMPEIKAQDKETEWLEHRLGMVTGSNFGKLVKKDRKGGFKLSDSKTAQDLIYKIAWERLLKEGNISNGLGRMNVNSQAMSHGDDYEGQAILKFTEVTGIEVDYKQKFIQLDDFIGGTPDGFIGDNGLIEIKCPWNGGNHLKTLLTGEIYNPDYFYQMQGYLWVTGRDYCYFCTYDPDLVDELQLSINKVERDEDTIEGISMVMDLVKEQIQAIMNNEKLKTK